MQQLALHQITMIEGGPQGLVRFAAEMDIDRICLFTASPQHGDGTAMFPFVDPNDARSFRKLLRETGVRIINAEYFPVKPGCDVEAYRPGIARAAELGAKRIVTHILETDPSRIRDQLSSLCMIAAESGLGVGLEFTGFSGGCDSLSAAAALHARLNQPGLTIAVDALHLFRTGGTLEQLKAVNPAIIGYAQLCDGPDFRRSTDYLDEAMNRMIPGEGIFPLRDFAAALGSHVDIDIEVPCAAPNVDARAWARGAIAASRKLLS